MHETPCAIKVAETAYVVSDARGPGQITPEEFKYGESQRALFFVR